MSCFNNYHHHHITIQVDPVCDREIEIYNRAKIDTRSLYNRQIYAVLVVSMRLYHSNRPHKHTQKERSAWTVTCIHDMRSTVSLHTLNQKHIHVYRTIGVNRHAVSSLVWLIADTDSDFSFSCTHIYPESTTHTIFSYNDIPIIITLFFSA